MLRDAFGNRMLPFDSEGARAYADIAFRRRAAGRPVAHLDCQIAAIARSRSMVVATRNVRDFEDMGIEIVELRSNSMTSLAVRFTHGQHGLSRGVFDVYASSHTRTPSVTSFENGVRYGEEPR